MTTTNYIVFHDQASFNLFQLNNSHIDTRNFKYIQVGNEKPINNKVIYAKSFTYNIEKFPTLLAFTAWYLISKNKLCKTENVGIFEYDVIFKEPPIDVELKDNIIGFFKRPTNELLYIQCIPEFIKLIGGFNMISQEWNATSNFIMPVKFLDKFVNWYILYIPAILRFQRHPHFHERAVNIFADKEYYLNETINLIEHKQLCSHKMPI